MEIRAQLYQKLQKKIELKVKQDDPLWKKPSILEVLELIFRGSTIGNPSAPLRWMTKSLWNTSIELENTIKANCVIEGELLEHINLYFS